MKRHCGFTLIEVLVALGIVATALMAGVRASGALADNAARQSDAMLAQLCAENEQIKIRLAQQLPSVGETHLECIQAGRSYAVKVSSQVTPNPNFRKVSVTVSRQAHALLQLSAVVGNN